MAVNDIYEVIQTPQAEGHLRSIAYYIAVELKNLDAAESFLDEVDLLDDYLRHSPQMCGFTDEEPWKDFIHKTKIKGYSYYAYFWIDEDSLTVYIVGYSFEGQNQKKFLSSLYF